jgi:hypothetical protein
LLADSFLAHIKPCLGRVYFVAEWCKQGNKSAGNCAATPIAA